MKGPGNFSKSQQRKGGLIHDTWVLDFQKRHCEVVCKRFHIKPTVRTQAWNKRFTHWVTQMGLWKKHCEEMMQKQTRKVLKACMWFHQQWGIPESLVYDNSERILLRKDSFV